MKPLGLGVSGAGAIAIQAVFMHMIEPDYQDKVVMTAVCDPVPGRAKAAAEKYNIPKYYESYEDMVADPNVDIITLCSPIGVHYAQGMAAVRAGKSVHFNKTMALTTAESTDLIDTAAAKGAKLVASPGQMLFPSVRAIRKSVLRGDIGMPTWTIGGSEGVLFYHVEEPIRDTGGSQPNIIPEWYYKKPAGGPEWDCTVYNIHSMTGILGPVKRVTAFSGQMMPTFEFKGKTIQSEVDDSTIILLDFGGSLFGVMYSSLKGGLTGLMSPDIFGTEGSIREGKLNGEPLYTGPVMALPGLNEKHQKISQCHVFADILQLVDWVAEGKPSVASAEHARHVIEIFEKGYESAATGRAIDLTTTFELIPEGEL